VLAAYTAASKAWLQEHAHTQYCAAMATPETTTLTSSAHVTKLDREELWNKAIMIHMYHGLQVPCQQKPSCNSTLTN